MGKNKNKMKDSKFPLGHGYTAVIKIDGTSWKLKRKIGGRSMTIVRGSIHDDDPDLVNLQRNCRDGTSLESIRFSLALRKANIAYNAKTRPAELPITPEG